MMLESLAVVQAQLGDSLSDYCTLQTDGTTKFGEHYDISTADGTTYCLGMCHVFSGSASNSLETFKEILTDLDDVNAALEVCLCIVCSLSSGSAHSSGCVVNGSSAMAAS